MDNEKYGIELELLTDKFNKQMQKVKKEASTLPKKVVMKNESGWMKASPQQWKDFINGGEKAGQEVSKIQKQYVSLSGVSKTASQSIAKGFDGMISKIKRFGLSLLSIRSIWALASKASSAYLAQDTALANRLQSAWAGLGALLAPIIERIVNIIAKAVKYIAIFIKALTGVDLLAKATAKSMSGTAKSAKGLNKALAGFDELNNLDTEAGGGADIGGGFAGLNDVEIDMEWAKKIESFGEWVKANKDLILGLFIGIGTIIAGIKLVEFVGSLIKIGEALGVVKTFLEPFFTVIASNWELILGIGTAIVGVVIAISGLIAYLQNPTWANFGKIIQGIGIGIIGIGIAFAGLPAIIVGGVLLIVGTIIQYWEEIKTFLQNGIDWLVSKTDWVRENFGIVGEFIYETFTSVLQLVLDIFDNVFKTIKGVLDGIITFIKGVFTGDWKLAWEGIKKIFSSIWEGLKGIVSTVWNFIKGLVLNIGQKAGDIITGVFKGIVNGVLSAIETILNAPIKAINKLIGVINKVPGINLGKLSTFNLPRLNVGTNYVPEDQIAMIHKGEAVIPKKFNSKEYFGGSNDETNAKLEELIDAVRNIEINPYTTIKDVGKSALNYINNKSRQLGESVVV